MVPNLIRAPDFWSPRNMGPKKFGPHMKTSWGPNEIGDYFSYSLQNKIQYLQILKTSSAHMKKFVKLQQAISLNVKKQLISDDLG